MYNVSFQRPNALICVCDAVNRNVERIFFSANITILSTDKFSEYGSRKLFVIFNCITFLVLLAKML